MFREFKTIYNLNWIYVFILLIIFWIGEINLYSAAGGSLDPWASNQLIRFLFFLPLFFLVTMLEPKFIYNFAEIFLILVLIGLITTLIFGYTGMGATRWIRIAGFNLQVSEFTKIALVISMAKYFHKLNAEKSIGLFKSILPLIVSIIFLLRISPASNEIIS